MATQISSSLASYSSIQQKQAEFKFPVRLPFGFTIEGINIGYREVSSLISSSKINGSLINIIPIRSNLSSKSSLGGQIKNNSKLLTPGLIDTTSIGPSTIMNNFKLVSLLVSVTSNNSLIRTMSHITSSLTSTIVVNGQIGEKLYLISNLNSNASISGKLASTNNLFTNLAANTNCNIALSSIKSFIVPQTINSVSTIAGTATAIFKLVTNIIANTSEAGVGSNQIKLESDFNSFLNIHGIIYRTIQSDLISHSDITLPQKLVFPLVFPWQFVDGALKSQEIASNLNVTSSIINNSIQDLLTVDFVSKSTITGNISSCCKETSTISTSSNVSISNAILKCNELSQVSAMLNVNSSIKNNQKVSGNVNNISTVLFDDVEVSFSLDSGLNSGSSVVPDITPNFSLTAITGTTNLWSGGFSVYNNYSVPASIALLEETYQGQPIYRLAMTVDDAHASSLASFQASLSSHGVFGGSLSWAIDTLYVCSVYWRPVNKPDTVFGGIASNTSGWKTGTTTYLDDGWRRYYRYRTGAGVATKTDFVHHSFYCPSLQLNETIYIDVCCPQTEQGVTIPSPYVFGVRPEGRVLETSSINGLVQLSIFSDTDMISLTSIDLTDCSLDTFLYGDSLSELIAEGLVTLDSSFNVDIITNSVIGSVILIKSFIVPSSINATSVITGVQTAIFKLVTNIVANTSIASVDLNQIRLLSSFISSSDIHGTTHDLIESDLNSCSNILLPQIFDFPLVFPLLFVDGGSLVLGISGTLNVRSSIVNSSIQDLLVDNLTAQSEMNGTITCKYSIAKAEAEVATNNISANITLQCQSGGQLSSRSNATAIIKEQLKLLSGITSSSTISGTLVSNQKIISNVISSININAVSSIIALDLNYLYLLTLAGKFNSNVKGNVKLVMNSLFVSKYVNYPHAALFSKNTLSISYEKNIEQSVIFKSTERITEQPFSLKDNVIKISNIYKMVIFNQKTLNSISLIEAYNVGVQFIDILYQIKH